MIFQNLRWCIAVFPSLFFWYPFYLKEDKPKLNSCKYEKTGCEVCMIQRKQDKWNRSFKSFSIVYLLLTGIFLHITGLHSIEDNTGRKWPVLFLDMFFQRIMQIKFVQACVVKEISWHITYFTLQLKCLWNKTRKDMKSLFQLWIKL
jgi:hypothetical protein